MTDNTDKTAQITCGDIELIEGNVKVCLEFLGEGSCGDYDAEDPNDEPLLRFSVYGNRAEIEKKNDSTDDYAWDGGGDGEPWVALADASYCTNLPATLPEADQRAALAVLMLEVKDPVEDGHPIKKLCERLSWIAPGWLPKSA